MEYGQLQIVKRTDDLRDITEEFPGQLTLQLTRQLTGKLTGELTGELIGELTEMLTDPLTELLTECQGFICKKRPNRSVNTRSSR